MNNTDLIGQIDLLSLASVAVENINGKQCIVIPTGDNPSIYLFSTRDRKSRAYLDIIVKESANGSFGNTHFIKASVGRSNRERLGIGREDLPRYTPIIGNLKPFGGAASVSESGSHMQGAPIVDDLPEDGFVSF